MEGGEERAGTMAGAAFCCIPASELVDNVKIPAAWAAPRVKPDSVAVTAEVPVAAPEPRVRTMLVLVEVAAELAVAVNNGTLQAAMLAVPRK